MADLTMRPARGRRRAERWEYALYFAAIYPLCFAFALGARLLPRERRPFSSDMRRSVFADARAAADTVLPFVFSG